MPDNRALAILIDPNSEEWFVAHGPDTKDRSEALAFLNESVAIKAACSRIFGERNPFWPSEWESAKRTREEHKGWSYRVEKVNA